MYNLTTTTTYLMQRYEYLHVTREREREIKAIEVKKNRVILDRYLYLLHAEMDFKFKS